ncbi:antimicrobial peptide NK-lysin-like isoform 2-T2 [Salvelinus alpinus]|uniref:antimicrobial peptide NK-lysin-like isoform X2 n=1 Tax=Salvelinus alpinus TaxID=8036 RepID=UPI0039FBEEF6
MRVVNIGLLLVCAAFAQSFKSQGGGSLREEEDMWGNYLMERDDNHAAIKAIPGPCSACKGIINKVKAKLNGDNDRDDIAAILDSVCRSLGKLKGICKKLVNKYKEQLIDALVSDVDARVACKKLKLCK